MPSDRDELGGGQMLRAGHGQILHADAQSIPDGGHAGPADEGLSTNANIGSLISAIRYWHRRRCFAMEQRKRTDLALGSFLRTALGWTKALPDADRKRINDQAQSLIELGEAEAKGKPVETGEPAYVEWRDVILASLAARAPFDAIEKRAKKEMAGLVPALPIYGWAEAVRGFGDVSLAIIVAEAGDLSDYPKKGHLWKRMGVAVMDGIRQGGLSKAAGKDAWIAHGYNRMRRSRMWNIGDALIKGNGEGPYRTAYLARKDYERARAEAAGLTVVPAAKIPAKRAAEFMSDGHVHRRAQRYMEKRLLRDLWQAWRRAGEDVSEGIDQALPADEHRIEREAISALPEGAALAMPTAQTYAGEAINQVPETARGSLPSPQPHEGKAIPSLPERATVPVPTPRSKAA